MVISSSLMPQNPLHQAAAHPAPLPPPVAGPKFPAGKGVLGRILTSLLQKSAFNLKKTISSQKSCNSKLKCVFGDFNGFYPGDLWHSHRWPILRSFSNGTMVILRRLLQSLRRARITITRWEIRRQQRSQDLISNHEKVASSGTAFFPEFLVYSGLNMD